MSTFATASRCRPTSTRKSSDNSCAEPAVPDRPGRGREGRTKTPLGTVHAGLRSGRHRSRMAVAQIHVVDRCLVRGPREASRGDVGHGRPTGGPCRPHAGRRRRDRVGSVRHGRFCRSVPRPGGRDRPRTWPICLQWNEIRVVTRLPTVHRGTVRDDRSAAQRAGRAGAVKPHRMLTSSGPHEGAQPLNPM